MPLRDAVRARWIEYTEGLEGGIPCLYNDIRGIVTIAYGNVVDSPSAVAALPLWFPGGIPASTAAKVVAFHKVKEDRNADVQGWRYAANLSPLRLRPDDMHALAFQRLDTNHADLVKQLPEFDDMNACAQMAMHSWAWAVGTRSPYPRLFAALRAGDFELASREIFMREETTDANGKTIINRGLIPRNVRNKILMLNAGYVRDAHLDPDTIDWVHDIKKSEDPTQPSYVPPLPEEVTGSGGTIHPSIFLDDARLSEDDDTKR